MIGGMEEEGGKQVVKTAIRNKALEMDQELLAIAVYSNHVRCESNSSFDRKGCFKIQKCSPYRPTRKWNNE